MSNLTNKFMNRVFRRVSGLAWDFMSGKVGVKTANGIYTCEVTDAGGQVTVNPLDSFSTAIPAFAMQTQKADVQLGDLIVGEEKIIGWVVENQPVAYKVLDHNGHTKTYSPPKVAVSLTGAGGDPTVLVVRNLFSLTGGQDGATGLAGNLLPLLMLGKGGKDLEKLLPVLLMSGSLGGGAQAGGMNGLLPLLLLKDGGLGGSGSSMDKLLPLMLMGGLGGGAGGSAVNPMMAMALLGDTDLFGGFGSFGDDDSTPALQPIRSSVPPLTRRY